MMSKIVVRIGRSLSNIFLSFWVPKLSLDIFVGKWNDKDLPLHPIFDKYMTQRLRKIYYGKKIRGHS